MYLGDKEIVSLVENTATLKGGEKMELTPYQIHFLVTDEKLSEPEYDEKKGLAVMTILSEAFDTLGISYAEFAEGVRKFDASFMKQRNLAICSALGIDTTGKDPTDISCIKYRDMLAHLPKE